MRSFLDYIRFKYIPCDVLVKEVWNIINLFHSQYQGSIYSNTVNIHRTVGMYFLISTGNRGDIE